MIKENVILIVQWVVIGIMCLSVLSLTKNNKQINKDLESKEFYISNNQLIENYGINYIDDLRNNTHKVVIKYEYNGETIYINKNLPEPTDSVYSFKHQSVGNKTKHELQNNFQTYNFNVD